MTRVEPIEILGEQLLDVEDVLIDMAEDWIIRLIHALLQDFHKNRLEGLRIVDVRKIDDGFILHRSTQHLFYQCLCFRIYRCPSLDVYDLIEEAHYQISKLALVACEPLVTY